MFAKNECDNTGGWHLAKLDLRVMKYLKLSFPCVFQFQNHEILTVSAGFSDALSVDLKLGEPVLTGRNRSFCCKDNGFCECWQLVKQATERLILHWLSGKDT